MHLNNFFRVLHDSFLLQHNLEDLRHPGNDQPSLIDFIFIDKLMLVSDVQHQAPLVKSDHIVLTFRFNSYLDFSKSKELSAINTGPGGMENNATNDSLDNSDEDVDFQFSISASIFY